MPGLVKVGLIGGGGIANAHATGYREHADVITVAAIADVDQSTAQRRAEELGAAPYADYRQMIAEADLDAVDICLPHHLHYPVTEACVKADVHVFLEKPVSISYEEGLLQKKLEDENDQKICVCFQNRLNASFVTLQEWLSKEETGRITGIKALSQIL